MSPDSKYVKTYLSVVLILLLLVGLINFLADPLWYFQGNRLAGPNLPWNERMTKTNLFLKSPSAYDCLILGTSRTTLLNPAALQQNRCFNYSFSGAKIEEYVSYAKYIQQKGLQPKKVYVEIELSSFNRRSNPRSFDAVADPMPAYRAYLFSLDVLKLSLRTINHDYSFNRLYDQNFHGFLADDIPTYEPELVAQQEQKECDASRLENFQALKQIFPDTSLIGFVAPVSGWYVFNNSYTKGLLNCQLAGIDQVADLFDGLYDFAIPSRLTSRTNNTYDGNHYYPSVFEKVAQVLEGERSHPGVDVKALTLIDYQTLYATRLKEFLERIGAEQFWQG